MALASEPQKEAVRQEFTKQATAYAASPTVADPERVERLIAAVNPSAGARVLEMATGPGYVAMGFAAVTREVVGVDLTAAPLAITEKTRQDRGLANLRFETADADRLPFPDGPFDVVVSRLAFHHFAEPARALAEMARVCRADGTVAVEDFTASEDPARAEFHNRLERLRDPSHTSALPWSGLLALLRGAGLEIEEVCSGRITQPVDSWFATAQTPPDREAEVRAMLERDALGDLSGVRPFVREGEWFFTHRPAIVVGRKLERRRD